MILHMEVKPVTSWSLITEVHRGHPHSLYVTHHRFIEAALTGLPPSSQLLATSASNVAVDNMV